MPLTVERIRPKEYRIAGGRWPVQLSVLLANPALDGVQVAERVRREVIFRLGDAHSGRGIARADKEVAADVVARLVLEDWSDSSPSPGSALMR